MFCPATVEYPVGYDLPSQPKKLVDQVTAPVADYIMRQAWQSFIEREWKLNTRRFKIGKSLHSRGKIMIFD
jgi:hypothetical protein